jgi:hypothetical protein
MIDSVARVVHQFNGSFMALYLLGNNLIYLSSSRNIHVAYFVSGVICLPSTLLKSLGAIVLVRVVLVSTVVVDVLFVVHALSMLFCLTLRLLAVEPVLTLCFRETIDLSTCVVIQ